MSHISTNHPTIELKDYYLLNNSTQLCKNINCKLFNTELPFVDIFKGYKPHCNASCAGCSEESVKKREQTNLIKYGQKYALCTSEVKEKSKVTRQNKYDNSNYDIGVYKKNRQDKHEQFKLEQNCTEQSYLLKEYGQGWYKSKVVPTIIHPETKCRFVDNDRIPDIIDYFEKHLKYRKSELENKYLTRIRELTTYKVESSFRKLIAPLELDIYIADLNIAFEINGTRWHSDKFSTKTYHQVKSARCREVNTRLIHLYEFEDFEQNIALIDDLLNNGEDNFDKTRYDKYNFGSYTEPNIIYKDLKYTVYDAGTREEGEK